MNFKQINQVFKTERQAIELLEKMLWGPRPICPYCNLHSATYVKSEQRYQCNSCNIRFSSMAQTPFKKSKLDLRKWFTAILLQRQTTSRSLAKEIGTTKDTANLMLKKLREANFVERELIEKIRQKVHELLS